MVTPGADDAEAVGIRPLGAHFAPFSMPGQQYRRHYAYRPMKWVDEVNIFSRRLFARRPVATPCVISRRAHMLILIAAPPRSIDAFSPPYSTRRLFSTEASRLMLFSLDKEVGRSIWPGGSRRASRISPPRTMRGLASGDAGCCRKDFILPRVVSRCRAYAHSRRHSPGSQPGQLT